MLTFLILARKTKTTKYLQLWVELFCTAPVGGKIGVRNLYCSTAKQLNILPKCPHLPLSNSCVKASCFPFNCSLLSESLCLVVVLAQNILLKQIRL